MNNTLDALLDGLAGARADRPGEVLSIACDSRSVTPGALFVALPGERTDGRRFVADAIARGAAAVAARGARPAELPEAMPFVALDGDPRLLLAELCRRFFGAPDARLQVVGVTGTNGKTTTTNLVAGAFRGAGRECAVGGTNGMFAGHYRAPGTLTTPEAPALWGFLSAAVDEGCSAAAIEVSSAALVAGRAHALQFAAGVLTMFGRDHLDQHGALENYLAAKQVLFEVLSADAVAVLPADDAAAPPFCAATRARVITFGENEGPLGVPDWRVSEHRPLASGASFRLTGPGFDQVVQSPRAGGWDARNTAAAVACATALGVPAADAVRGALSVARVDGRWELVDAGQPWSAIVDYAHTPDALERTLALLRRVTNGRVIVVFGCGGERDPGKRPEMGRIAARYADLSIVTEDNPRGEDPDLIASAIIDGIVAAGGACERVAGRALAIVRAVELAQPGDAVLVTGKGHETYQEIAGVRRHFDDREELRAAIAARTGRVDA